MCELYGSVPIIGSLPLPPLLDRLVALGELGSRAMSLLVHLAAHPQDARPCVLNN
jgi:hypothetical protein